MGKVKDQEQTSDFPSIGAPATRALTAAGYSQLVQLTQVRADSLLQLHGVGPKAIRILRETLAAKGMSFLDEQSTNSKGNYAEVNGINLYYEIHGPQSSTQTPLVLLHGGLGMIEMMSNLLNVFAQDRQVIGLDLQGHGRTADIDRPLRYQDMGDDVAALIRHLGIAQADVLGYSLGAGTALRTAIQHPDLVRKLVIVSTPYKREGWFPEVLAAFDQMGAPAAEFMKSSPVYQSYIKVAPKPENFPLLLDKVGDMLRQPYDWSSEVALLPMPVLLAFADADSVPARHVAEFYALLGGSQRDAGWDGSHMPKSQLAVLPGLSHYNIFMSPILSTVTKNFLDV